MNIFMMFIMSTMFLLVANMLMIISNLLSKKIKINYEKMTPFESGFNPKKMNYSNFSLRFFMITIIFLIFDVEIALLMPMLMTMMISKIMNWMIMSISFMIILMVGLIYEWNQSALNWI